jgi:hypothetical protein
MSDGLNCTGKNCCFADWYSRNGLIDQKNIKIELSKIFEWYKKDFVSGGTSLLEYINQFLDEPILITFYQAKFQEYDWGLNEQKK